MTEGEQKELEEYRRRQAAEAAVESYLERQQPKTLQHVEKTARDQVDAYLREKLTTYRWVFASAAVVAAALGVQGILNWSALAKQREETTRKQGEFNEQLRVMQTNAAEATRLLGEAGSLQEKATAQLVNILGLLQASADTVTRSNAEILRAQMDATKLLSSLTESSNEATEEYKQAHQALLELENAKAHAEKEVRDFLNEKLAEKKERVERLEQLTADLQTATQGLLQLRASDILILRTRGQAQIEIPDVCDGPAPRTYKLTFRLEENIRDDFKVNFKAERQGRPPVEDKIAIYGAMKRGTRNPIGELPGTPFDFEAFVYHDFVAADFAVLKIKPRENYRCPNA